MKMNINTEYDKVYDIRLATIDDIPDIMRFIDEHWRKGHIMAVDRSLFEYEYVHGDEVDFVLALKKETETIEGIFGFIRCSKDRTGDIWGSMWKVNESPETMKLLGIELAKRVYFLTGCRSHIGNGANPVTTVPLRKIFFRDKTAKMVQYYWLNTNIDKYSIAIINEPWKPKKKEGTPIYNVKELGTFDELKESFNIDIINNTPHKDMWYLKHRYYDHPIYKYSVFGIYDNNDKCCAVFMTRIVSAEGSSVLRITDYIGEHRMLTGIYDWINKTVKEQNYEYVDFFEFGIPDEFLESAGFRNRNDFNNIIPNYFEPFTRENIDIWTHYKFDGTTFFKADGDQDRPNIVRDMEA